MNLQPHIEQFCKRRDELESALSTPGVASDNRQLLELTREYSRMKKLAELGERYLKLRADIDASKELVKSEPADSELAELAREELPGLEAEQAKLGLELQYGIIPPNSTDSRDTIVEIRAGAGGAESALFCADLHRMYVRYAESQGWKVESMDASASDLGGFKEVIFGIKGQDVFKKLKFESGVHRVQRVPETESGGRIHTSAATVAVLPEPDEVDVQIDAGDLKIDTYRASGAGGQHVNTTDSAIRITHLPTNTVVTCQDGRSQHKNREKAMQVLRARLFEQQREATEGAEAEARKAMVGSGDRSERIRTYNFPQGRVTDHRIGLTLHKLPEIIAGPGLGELVDALIAEDEAKRLATLSD